MALKKDKSLKRLDSLKKQHAKLEEQLRSASPEEENRIKRKKLRIKDERAHIKRQLESWSPRSVKITSSNMEIEPIPGKEDFKVVPPVAKSA